MRVRPLTTLRPSSLCFLATQSQHPRWPPPRAPLHAHHLQLAPPRAAPCPLPPLLLLLMMMIPSLHTRSGCSLPWPSTRKPPCTTPFIRISSFKFRIFIFRPLSFPRGGGCILFLFPVLFHCTQGGGEPRVRLPPRWQQRHMQLGEQLVAPVAVDGQRPRRVAVVGPIGQVSACAHAPLACPPHSLRAWGRQAKMRLPRWGQGRGWSLRARKGQGRGRSAGVQACVRQEASSRWWPPWRWTGSGRAGWWWGCGWSAGCVRQCWPYAIRQTYDTAYHTCADGGKRRMGQHWRARPWPALFTPCVRAAVTNGGQHYGQ